MVSNAPKSTREVRDAPLTSARLRELGLFGALSDDVLDHLAGTLQTRRVSTGDTVFREGDGAAREMYVVLEGEMEVTKRSRRGRDTRVAILGPGDWFGEMSVIDLQTRSATVRALAPSRLIRFTAIEVLHAGQLGVWLEGLADFEYPVHAGGVPGDAELVEGLPGVGAGGFGVVLAGFDGGQVAEDDGALLVIGAGRVVQRGGEGFLRLREVPGLELGVALEGGEPDGREPGEPVR